MVHVRLPNSAEHPMKKRSRKNMLYLNLYQWTQTLRELTGGRQTHVNKHLCSDTVTQLHRYIVKY
jgi:hypothetical protein